MISKADSEQQIVWKDAAEITIPDESGIDEKEVLAIAESIDNTKKLFTPILITPEGNVVAGRHRFRACLYLGWGEIPCIEVSGSPLELELITLDENLCRRQLPAIERSRLMARRKAVYEQMFPETGHGRASSKGNGKARPTFTEDTAQKTGRSQRVVQEEVAIGEAITDDVAEMIRDTPVANNKAVLRTIAALPEEEQRKAAEKIVNGKASKKPAPRNGRLTRNDIEPLVKKGSKLLGQLARVLTELRMYRNHAQFLQDLKNELAGRMDWEDVAK